MNVCLGLLAAAAAELLTAVSFTLQTILYQGVAKGEGGGLYLKTHTTPIPQNGTHVTGIGGVTQR